MGRQLSGGLFLAFLLGMIVYALVTGKAPVRESMWGEVRRDERPGAYWGFLGMLGAIAGIVAYATFLPR